MPTKRATEYVSRRKDRSGRLTQVATKQCPKKKKKTEKTDTQPHQGKWYTVMCCVARQHKSRGEYMAVLALITIRCPPQDLKDKTNGGETPVYGGACAEHRAMPPETKRCGLGRC